MGSPGGSPSAHGASISRLAKLAQFGNITYKYLLTAHNMYFDCTLLPLLSVSPDFVSSNKFSFLPLCPPRRHHQVAGCSAGALPRCQGTSAPPLLHLRANISTSQLSLSRPLPTWTPHLVLLLACIPAARASSSGDDFSNNLFTDLGYSPAPPTCLPADSPSPPPRALRRLHRQAIPQPKHAAARARHLRVRPSRHHHRRDIVHPRRRRHAADGDHRAGARVARRGRDRADEVRIHVCV